MLADNSFPSATIQLRRFRVKDSSILEFLGDPYESKLAAIQALMAAWPERRFILVGDSGERDPEVYGEIARRFPDRILLVAIRDVTQEPRTSPRYETAFRRVPEDRWTVFDSPQSLPSISELTSAAPSP
jgi:phosphatidate phosphatase APP1